MTMTTMQRPHGWDDVWTYTTRWATRLVTPDGVPVAMVARYAPGLEAALIAPAAVAQAARAIRRAVVQHPEAGTGSDSPIAALRRVRRLLARVGPGGLAVLAAAGDGAIVVAAGGHTR